VRFRLNAILKLVNAVLLGTMGAAIEDAIRLHTMTDHTAATMRARGRQGVDRTFEAIEHVDFTAPVDLKALIIDIAAYFAALAFLLSHPALSFVHHTPLSQLLD
jgi:hypothetical protein